MTQLDAGISGGKAPLHWLALRCSIQRLRCAACRCPLSDEPNIAVQHAELAFSDVRHAVFRRIHPACPARALAGSKVWYRAPVCVQVVHQQRDPLRLRIVFFHQPAHPFRRSAPHGSAHRRRQWSPVPPRARTRRRTPPNRQLLRSPLHFPFSIPHTKAASFSCRHTSTLAPSHWHTRRRYAIRSTIHHARTRNVVLTDHQARLVCQQSD